MYARKILDKQALSRGELENILSDNIPLQDLIDDAFILREKYFGRKVKIHILNNVQNALCPEDCGYCGQAESSESETIAYPLKKREDILREAFQAQENGAYRYCMVLSGRGPSDRAIEHMCRAIGEIKEKTSLKTCLSAGLMTPDQIEKLKRAGLDRINHNLNTSENYYPRVCSTHSWQERYNTLKNSRQQGLELCSGAIFGMGEGLEDRLDIFESFARLKPESIPINFLLPIKGNRITEAQNLDPEICLRILCAMRYSSPASEIRIAAGREYHLGEKQALALYPANSLFAAGYLLTSGDAPDTTREMIEKAGFECELAR
jgi:biotin synthase